jgi:hypothetical protein
MQTKSRQISWVALLTTLPQPILRSPRIRTDTVRDRAILGQCRAHIQKMSSYNFLYRVDFCFFASIRISNSGVLSPIAFINPVKG